MAKTEAWICPVCNSNNTTETSNGFEDLCAYSHMRCEDCGAEWEDNFSVEYCGYNIHTEDGDTIIYDTKGDEIWPHTKS